MLPLGNHDNPNHVCSAPPVHVWWRAHWGPERLRTFPRSHLQPEAFPVFVMGAGDGGSVEGLREGRLASPTPCLLCALCLPTVTLPGVPRGIIS